MAQPHPPRFYTSRLTSPRGDECLDTGAAVCQIIKSRLVGAGMHMTETVRQILKTKGPQVWWLPPEATVYEAIALMADKRVGAVLVCREGRPLGIVSERDYARKVILHGKSSKDTLVREIMTTELYPVHPDQTVEECMELMTYKRTRYLPVMEGDRLLGIISIGDVVKDIISRQRRIISTLEDRLKESGQSGGL